MNDISVKSFLWALSLDCVSYYGPYGSSILTLEKNSMLDNNSIESVPDSILHGVSENKKHKKKVNHFLEEIFHVKSHMDYMLTMTFLKDPISSRLLRMNQLMMQLLNLDDKKISQIKKSSDKNNTQLMEFYEQVMAYRDQWTLDTYYAYQLSNAIAITRLSFYKGYIDRHQCQKHVIEISNLIKKHFKSFDDFGSKAATSYYVDVKARKKIEQLEVDFDKNRFSHVHYGVWQYFSWPDPEEKE